MVRLLKCQQKELDAKEEVYLSDIYKTREFALGLLYRLLDITESDLAPDELMEIEDFIRSWKWG